MQSCHISKSHMSVLSYVFALFFVFSWIIYRLDSWSIPLLFMLQYSWEFDSINFNFFNVFIHHSATCFLCLIVFCLCISLSYFYSINLCIYLNVILATTCGVPSSCPSLLAAPGFHLNIANSVRKLLSVASARRSSKSLKIYMNRKHSWMEWTI